MPKALLPEIETIDVAKKFSVDWKRPLEKLGKHVERLRTIPAELALRAKYHPQWKIGRIGRSTDASLERVSSFGDSLNPADRIIAEALERDAIHATRLWELDLPGSASMFESATRLAQILADRSRSPASNGKAILASTAEDMSGFPDLVSWALNPRIIDLVETYLGTPCAFGGVVVLHSNPDGREVSTRVWHRDREDIRMVKVMIYLSEVGPDDGPFEMLQADSQKTLDANLSWRYATIRDDALGAVLNCVDTGDASHRVTGDRGTTFLCDPASRHHRGRPPRQKCRSMMIYTYFAKSPAHSYFCPPAQLSRARLRELANGLSPRQASCLMWREQLPLSRHLIPGTRMTM